MDETEEMTTKDKDLISSITTAIKAIGKRHDGQYFDNILGECSERFGWDRQGVMAALDAAIRYHIVKEVSVNNKISYRIINTARKVCFRDNVESTSTQTTNDEPDVAKRSKSPDAVDALANELARFVDDFTSFKKFIHSEISLMKASQEKAHPPGQSLPLSLENPNYEKAFIRSLEARILSLERQLDQKQATIDKLLINNQLQHSQVQQKTTKGQENASEKTNTSRDNNANDKRDRTKSSQVGPEKINRGVAQEANAKTTESDNDSDSEDKDQHKTSTVTKKSKPSVVIVDDSMLNGITEHGLDKQHRIKVKAHPV